MDTTHSIVVIRVKTFQTETTIQLQLVNTVFQVNYGMVKYKVRKMTKSLLKHHSYCQMLWMRTTKAKDHFQSSLWILIAKLDSGKDFNH